MTSTDSAMALAGGRGVPGNAWEAVHEIAAVSVESELRRRGFEILTRDESFIDRRGDDVWWLMVARKPHNS